MWAAVKAGLLGLSLGLELKSSALTLCLNRFDKEVQAKFVDLYNKFAPEAEPETPSVEGQTTSEQHDAAQYADTRTLAQRVAEHGYSDTAKRAFNDALKASA